MSASTVPEPPPSSSKTKSTNVKPALPPEAPSQWSFVMRTDGSPFPETLASPHGEPTRTEPTRPTLPDYELLEELGRGGMGVVYKARHLKLNRLVALKMIIAGSFAGRDDRQRFYLEAETLAKLRHRNIVQIFDFGEQQGIPYFSLEFVPGGTLHRWLYLRKPGPQEAAEIVEQLARAIAYAHENGIIHRDLKPANVLLEPNPPTDADDHPLPTPKLVDFGLAKRETGGITQTGTMLGTPNYMAPEQTRGQTGTVTPAADIYGLGAILYELLAGRPPFIGTTPHEVIEQVILKEPTPPGRVKPGVPTDLETICLTCLNKNPQKRYGSARLLANDLRRFLNQEPILARRIGRLERARLWCRRNPLIALLTGVLFMGFVGLAILSGLLFSNLSQLRSTIKQVEEQKLRADNNLKAAREMIDRFTSLSEEIRGTKHPQVQRLQRRIMEEAAQYYQVFIKENQGRAELIYELTSAQIRLGDLLFNLGKYADATRVAEEAVAACEVQLKEQPADSMMVGTWAQAKMLRAKLASRQGQPTKSRDLYREVDAMLRPRKDMAETSDRERAALARVNHVLATDQYLAGKPQEAIDSIRLSLALRRKLLAERQQKLEAAQARQAGESELRKMRLDVALLHSDLGGTCGDLGVFLRESRWLEDAVEVLNEGIRSQEAALKLAPGEPIYRLRLTFHLSELSSTLERMQKVDEAARVQQAAIDGTLALSNEYPDVSEYASKAGMMLANRSKLLMEKKDYTAAVKDLRQAIDLQQAALKRLPEDVDIGLGLAFSYLRLAEVQQKQEDWPGMAASANEALTRFRVLEQQLQSRRDLLDYRNFAQHYLALARRRLGEVSVARKLFEDLLKQVRSRIAAGRVSSGIKGLEIEILAELAHCAAVDGHWKQAFEAMAEPCRLIDELKKSDEELLYDGACYRALRLAWFLKLPPEQADKLGTQADELAGEALIALKRAWEAGYRDRDQIMKDSDLAELRSRPEFQAWYSSLPARDPEKSTKP